MKRTLLFGCVPLAVVALGVILEITIIGDNSPRRLLLGSLNDVTKQSISIETGLSQLITGLATALIGGAAYYLRTRRKDMAIAIGSSVVNRLLVVILCSACLSVYFGQLWLASLRDQLIHDYLDFMSNTVLWPERLQSGFFLLALTWFAELVYLTERTPDRTIAALSPVPEKAMD